MQTVLAWLKAGDPPHWTWIAGAATLLLEDAISRSRFKANSTVQLVADVAYRLLGRVPGVGKVLALLGSGRSRVVLDIAADDPDRFITGLNEEARKALKVKPDLPGDSKNVPEGQE